MAPSQRSSSGTGLCGKRLGVFQSPGSADRRGTQDSGRGHPPRGLSADNPVRGLAARRLEHAHCAEILARRGRSFHPSSAKLPPVARRPALRVPGSREMMPAMVEAAVKTVLSLILAGLAAAYACGWLRLRAAGHTPPIWRLALYALGLTAVTAALLSPLDDLAAARFSAHMGQHLLLTMMAAPLLLLGNPLPLVLWGLPSRARRPLAATLRPRARLRAALSALTSLPVAGVLHVTTLWIWHLPFLYDASVEHEVVPAFEHATFFATAILFWSP